MLAACSSRNRRRFAMLAFAIVSLSATAAGAESPPAERFLAADTTIYLRFDGLDAHRTSYDQTALAEIMRGDFGHFVAYLLEFGAKSYRGSLQLQMTQAGAAPEEMVAYQEAMTGLAPMLNGVMQHGFVLGIEINGSLTESRGTLVLPRAGPYLDAAGQLLRGEFFKDDVEQKEIDGVAVWVVDERLNVRAPPMREAAWKEGDDVVIVWGPDAAESHASGPDAAEALVRRCRSRGDANLANSPLLASAADPDGRETVFRFRRVYASVLGQPFEKLPLFRSATGAQAVQ